MAVTVYSKPSCVQCNATKRALKKAGIAYTDIDLTQDEDALEKVKEMGFMSAPVVVTDSDTWSGFRPDKIKVLQQAVQTVDA
ncbi:MAG: glutaredoxin-like protein NrdH [Actinomycetaceae bacterium]|nr:glutaredoxin-like protein NrdH [Actinomycetaceae bacterium]MDY6082399.1 glutaredoxin-like protein NrdH [Actinomycetaceae bacterium]